MVLAEEVVVASFLLESSVKAASRSYALSLVGGLAPGVDGAVPTLCEVVSEARHL